jgi:DNA-binding transcriptional MerR regulator
VEKAPDAFRTISEVATDLNVPQHVLRFWESRFSEIKPMKRGGGRRYYRPDDVDLLRGIRHLLYGEGYTIRGVQRILKDQGLRYVQTVWQPGAQSAAQASERGSEDSDFEEADARAAERGRGLFGLLPSLIGNANEEPPAKAAAEAEEAEEGEDAEDLEDAEEEDVAEEEEDDSDEDAVDDDDDEEADDDEDEDDDEEEDEDEDDEEEDAAPARVMPRPLPLQRNVPQPAGGALRAAVSAEDMRKLESALRELTECRRLLDAAIKEKV